MLDVGDKDAHDLAIRFWDAGAIGVLEIPRLIEEWRSPRCPEFARSGRTTWRLFNAATEIIKGDLWRLPARTRAIHAILDEECGLRQKDTGYPPELPETIEVTA